MSVFDQMTLAFNDWYFKVWPSVTDGLHRILKWREWQEDKRATKARYEIKGVESTSDNAPRINVSKEENNP